MPDIKIVTEVAGRVCALPVEVGGSVGDGDDIVFVEAMKMEIPVAARRRRHAEIDPREASTTSLPKARCSRSSRPDRDLRRVRRPEKAHRTGVRLAPVPRNVGCATWLARGRCMH